MLIGNLPTRQPNPDTPLLNKWYSLFPRIPWDATDTDDDRAAKIKAKKSEGKFVVAFSKDCAADEKMLKAANLALITEVNNSGYKRVEDKDMIDIVLWFADCVGGYEGTVFNP